jgi:hypothetical protein
MSPLDRFPEIKGQEATPDRPIISVIRDFPDLTSLAVNKTIQAFVNGVDVFKYIGGKNNPFTPQQTALNVPLLRGDVDIHIAQSVQNSYFPSTVTKFFYTGDSWTGTADYTGFVPIRHLPYRIHEGSFLTAQDKLEMIDSVWREHKDSFTIRATLEAYREQATDFLYEQVQAAARSSILYAEPVERRRIAMVNLDGAIGDVTPYRDVQVLYDHSANNQKHYVYGYDFFLSNGVPIFISKDCPGRIQSAAVPGIGSTTLRPATGFSYKATGVVKRTVDFAVFLGTTDKITSIDFFVKPPQDAAVNPTSGSDRVGRVSILIPGETTRRVIYDSLLNPDGFGGRIVLDAPVSVPPDKFIQVSQDRTSLNLVTDADPDVEVTLWLNRRVTLFGPEYNATGDGLKHLATLASCGIPGESLTDKIKVAAVMKARTEKSIDAFETLVEALLEIPISPYAGAVDRITLANPGGFVDGQIDIHGAIMEFFEPVIFSVAVGDQTEFMQRLVDKNIDGVTIDDFESDPTFMDGPDANLYIDSKIVGAVQVPDEFAIPGATARDYARILLRDKSWRINLNGFATFQLASRPGLVDNLFHCIDAMKPSGTDYWIRLSDGTPVIRGTPSRVELDVSSKLGLQTDYAHRIYDAAATDGFNVSQFEATSVKYSGGIQKIGDAVRLRFTFYVGIILHIFNLNETLTASDFITDPTSPMDGFFKRLVSNFNVGFGGGGDLGVLTNSLIAEFIPGTDPDKIRFVPRATAVTSGDLDVFKFTQFPTFAIFQTGGDGIALLAPNVDSPLISGDTSRIFLTVGEGIQLMDGYRELKVTKPGDPVGTEALNDTGAGPYDTTFINIPTATSISLDSDPVTVPAPTPPQTLTDTALYVGRVSLVGVANSVFLGSETSTFLSYAASGTMAPFDSIQITFSAVAGSNGEPAVPAHIVSRTALANDGSPFSPESVMAGLAGNIDRDPVISPFFKAKYAPVVSGFIIEIIPIKHSDAARWTMVVTSVTDALITFTVGSFGVITSNGTNVVTVNPPYVADSFLSIDFTYNTINAFTSPLVIPPMMLVPFKDSTDGSNLFEYQFGFSRKIIDNTFSPVTINAVVNVVGLAPSYFGDYGVRPLVTPDVDLYSARIITDDYPEYGRDDDAVVLSDAHLSGGKVENFPEDVATCVNRINITELPTIEITITDIDLTSRIASVRQRGIRNALDIQNGFNVYYSYQPVVTDPGAGFTAGSLHDVRQFICELAAFQVVNFVRTSSFLWALLADGSYELLRNADAPVGSPNRPDIPANADYDEVAGDPTDSIHVNAVLPNGSVTLNGPVIANGLLSIIISKIGWDHEVGITISALAADSDTVTLNALRTAVAANSEVAPLIDFATSTVAGTGPAVWTINSVRINARLQFSSATVLPVNFFISASPFGSPLFGVGSFAVPRVVGFCKSVDVYRYYDGPEATIEIVEGVRVPTYGITALEEEFAVSGNINDIPVGAISPGYIANFRAGNMKAYDPAYAANPVPVNPRRSDWRNSVASKNRAFGLDDETSEFTEKFTIE